MHDVDEGKVFAELAEYRNKTKIFQKPYLWKAVQHTTPSTWWSGLCGSTDLSKVACRILDLPPTSAAVERSFSRHSLVHSQKRNRLTTARAAKLVYIAQNLQFLDDGDVDSVSAIPKVSKFASTIRSGGAGAEVSVRPESDSDSESEWSDSEIAILGNEGDTGTEKSDPHAGRLDLRVTSESDDSRV